jgi:hypothetical protein
MGAVRLEGTHRGVRSDAYFADVVRDRITFRWASFLSAMVVRAPAVHGCRRTSGSCLVAASNLRHELSTTVDKHHYILWWRMGNHYR